jgi:hypothetical protein
MLIVRPLDMGQPCLCITKFSGRISGYRVYTLNLVDLHGATHFLHTKTA